MITVAMLLTQIL